jgi:hypothetical protein
MFPDTEARFMAYSPNGYKDELSAEAFGVTVCLFAYSHLAFRGDALAAICAEQYHRLRDYAMDHAEAAAIFAAID